MSARRGLSLVELLVGVAVAALLAGLTAAAVQRARAAADRARCAHHLRQLGLALHQYHHGHHRLPAGTAGPADPMPFSAWTARLLPYLEQSALWAETAAAFRSERDFLKDPPHRRLAEPVPLFACPADPRARVPGVTPSGARRGLTSYLGVEGVNTARRDGVLFLNSAVRLADVADGTGQTLLAGERPPSSDFVLGWWYAGWGMDQTGSGDAVLGVRAKNNKEYAPGCETGPYHFRPGRPDDPCAAFGFWSVHPGGAHFALCDGSVRFLRYAADPLMPALATRAADDTFAGRD
jgi:prepilin-type N-terminal cleavage/methylation domain-containing protein/prepilin-type processing-associated H-X9-DG protein